MSVHSRHSGYSCIALVFLWKTKSVAEPLLYDKSVHLHLTLDYVARGMWVRVIKTCVLLAERPNRPNRPKLATPFIFFFLIAIPTQTSTIFAKVGCIVQVVE